MDDKVFMKAVREVVLVAFDQAASDFRENPTGDRWGALESAMWARQAITGPSTDTDQIIGLLKNAGIGTWVGLLRAHHEGKDRPPPQKAIGRPVSRI